MAEAERTIGTPDTPTPSASGAEPGLPDTTSPPDGTAPSAAAGDTATPDGRPGPRQDGDGREDRDGRQDGPGQEGQGATQAREDQEGARDRQGSPGQRRIAVLFAVAALAYLLDVVSKVIVVAKLEHHEGIALLGDWLRLEAVRNPGAAFGMGQAFTVLFTVIAAAVIFVIGRLARKLYSLPWAVALGLLLGGALGNLTDRLLRSPGVFEGAVVDFIAPRYFAVFNLADSAIVCGGILIVLLSFRGLDPDGSVHKD